MEYRLSNSRPEIIKTLANRLTAGCSLTVWQKRPDGTRSFLQKMNFHSLFADEGVFTIKIDKPLTQYLDPAMEVYFLLEEHDFIFKTKMAIDQKEYITLQIPREVRLREFRVHERTYFTLEDRKSVEVVFTPKNSEATSISLTCPLINLSEGGACIVVSKETISNIDFSSNILLKFTSDFQTAVIRNMRIFVKKNLNKDELYAIGVQFQEAGPINI